MSNRKADDSSAMQTTIRDALRRFNELSRRLKGAGSQEQSQFSAVSERFCQVVAESGGLELRISELESYMPRGLEPGSL